MNEKKEEKLREHNFDGIQECDNDLPRWWVNLFKLTVLFGFIYLAWYHLPFFPSKSLIQEYEEKTQATAPAAAGAVEKSFDFEKALSDSAIVGKGKEVFAANCVACHAADGGGTIGPNLVDDFWIHGNTSEHLTKVIADGVTAKGMPAWGSILGPEKIQHVLVYIGSLQGTKPAAPKAQQGNPGKLKL